jgi:hypothetical protein
MSLIENSSISLKFDLNISLDKFKILIQKITNSNFFSIIASINPDIITNIDITQNIVTLSIKNLIDIDDQELNVLCFNFSLKISDNILINCISNPFTPFEGISIIEHEKFDILINPSSLIFNMKYDLKKQPSYVGNMLEIYFKKIFEHFVNYINSN